jgi:glycosyltransferase involved in cell wall biosynthesis
VSEHLPFISVIIPVYNDTERLRGCLTALAGQTYPQSRFEVIVVDNGSTPPVPDTIAIGNVTLLREPRPGGFLARNTGIGAAKGELLAFTDADCLPYADWLEALAKAVGDEHVIVAGHIEVFPRDLSHPTPSERFDMLWGFPQHRFVADGYGASANLALPCAVFDAVGPYDATLLSDGDQEWCQRAVARGFAIRYAVGARVRHPARDTLRQHVTKTRRLTGGLFQRAKGGNKIGAGRRSALYHARPPLRRLLQVIASPGLGSFHDRVSLAGILIGLRVVSLAEWVRLELGGKQERR